MFFLGVGNSLIGAAAREIGLSPTQIGLMLALQNVGFGIGVAVSGALADVLPKPRILFVGSVILAAGFFAFYRVPTFWVNALIMGLIGAGIGAYEGATDAMMFDLHERRAAFFVNINHLFVTVGSAIIALYLIFLQLRWRAAVVQSSAIVALLAIIFLLTYLPSVRRTTSTFGDRLRTIGRSPLIAVLFLATVVTIGVEAGAVGLLSTYLVEVRAFDALTAKLGLVVQLAGMAVGRVLIGYLAQTHRLRQTILILYATSTVMFGLLFLVNLGALTLPVAFLAGMTMSAQLPLMLAYAGLAFREMTGVVLGAVKIGIPVGGIVVPLLISGVTSATSFPVALAILPLALLIGLLLLALPISRAPHLARADAR